MGAIRRQRTLVVEDDPDMREIYARVFGAMLDEGFAAVVVEDGEQALDILRHEAVDLMVLDWNLPGISGEALLRALRAHPKTRSIGVLMVTGKCSPAEEIQALDSGADDHLAKPFDEKVLAARLRSLCRRRALTAGKGATLGYRGLELDVDEDVVRLDGRRVHLTPKEMGLLELFLRRPNILQTHAGLWDALWGYESERWEHLLIVTLSSLRGKLGEKWGSRLACHRGKGYIFESPL